MAMVIRAFPLKGSMEELDRFATALRTEQAAGATAFYEGLGVAYESWYLQKTDHGNWVIALNVIDDPQEAAPRYAQSTESFDAWFKEQVLKLTGIDPSQTPLGPPTTLVYEWISKQRKHIDLLA